VNIHGVKDVDTIEEKDMDVTKGMETDTGVVMVMEEDIGINRVSE
jgi:hypothetical protein